MFNEKIPFKTFTLDGTQFETRSAFWDVAPSGPHRRSGEGGIEEWGEILSDRCSITYTKGHLETCSVGLVLQQT